MNSNQARRRRWLAAAVVCVVAIAITTATSAAQRPRAALAAQTLTLTSITTYQPGFDQVIKNFEAANPGVTINASYGSAGPQYTTQIATQFAAGAGDDLVYLLPGNGSADAVWPFAKNGYLLNLSSQPWVKSLYKPDASLMSYKGKVLTWDLGSSTEAVLNYNKQYFASHSLTLPTTFAQLLTTCKTIKAFGEIPIAFGAGLGAVDINDLDSLAGNTVFSSDPNWLAQRAAGKTTFVKSTGWRAAVEQLVQMENAGCFQPGVAGLSLPGMVSEFGSGQAAMMFTYGGLDALVSLSAPSLKIGMLTPPGVTAKSTLLTTAPAGGLGIWAKSPHIAAAEAFVKFLATPAESTVFATLNDLISVQDEVSGQIPAAYAGVASYFKDHKTVATATWEWPNTAMENNAGEQVMGIFTGQATVTQVLQDLDSDWKTGS